MAQYDTPSLSPFRDGLRAAHDPSQGGSVCISFPKGFIPYVLGALQPMLSPEVWEGDEALVRRNIELTHTFLAELAAAASSHAATLLADGFLIDICPEPPECPECPECAPCSSGGGGGGRESDEDLMPGIQGLHWEGTKLIIDWDACCHEEVPQLHTYSSGGGGGGGTGTPTLEDALDDEIEIADPTKSGWEPAPDTASLTCRKAYALGHALHVLFTAVEEAAVMDWYSAIVHVRAAVPALELTYLQAFNGVVPVINTGIVSYGWVNPVWGDNQEAELICRLHDGLVPDTLAMTEAEWSVLEDAWKGLVNVQSRILLGNIYYQIKKSQWRQVIAAGAGNDDATCDCPDVVNQPSIEGIPAGLTWVAVFDWRLGNWGWEITQATQDSTGLWKAGASNETAIFAERKGTGAHLQTSVHYVRHEFAEWLMPTGAYHTDMHNWGVNGSRIWNEQITRKYNPEWSGVVNNIYADGCYYFNMGQMINGVSGQTRITRTIFAGLGANPFEGLEPDSPVVGC